jgi:hypothetical protein
MKFLKISIVLISILQSCFSKVEEKPDLKTIKLHSSSIIKMDYNGHVYLNGSIRHFIDTIPLVIQKRNQDRGKNKKILVSGIFLFDTGANGLILDSLYYRNSPMKHLNKDTIRMTGVGSNYQSSIRILESINFDYLGHNFTSDQNFIVDLKQGFGRKIDGVVGWNFFKGKVIEINYKKRYIQIYDANNLSIDSKFRKFPLIIENRNIFLQGTVAVSDNLKIKGNFLLDIGSNGTLNLTSNISEKYNLDSLFEEKVKFISRSVGIGGTSSGFVARVKAVSLDDFELLNPVISISNNISGMLHTEDYVGIIGNKLLERFDLILDLKNKMAYLRPNEDFKLPFSPPRLGFRFTDRTDICDGWIIQSMNIGSNGDKLGLKIGDIITHLNGISVKSIKEAAFKEMISIKNETLDIKIERINRVLHLKLKSYL